MHLTLQLKEVCTHQLKFNSFCIGTLAYEHLVNAVFQSIKKVSTFNSYIPNIGFCCRGRDDSFLI